MDRERPCQQQELGPLGESLAYAKSHAVVILLYPAPPHPVWTYNHLLRPKGASACACRVRLPSNRGLLDGQPCDSVLEGLDGAGEVAVGAVGWHDVGVAAELQVGGVREVDRRLGCGHKGQRCTEGVRVAQNVVKDVVAHHHAHRRCDEQRLVCRVLPTPQTVSASIPRTRS